MADKPSSTEHSVRGAVLNPEKTPKPHGDGGKSRDESDPGYQGPRDDGDIQPVFKAEPGVTVSAGGSDNAVSHASIFGMAEENRQKREKEADDKTAEFVVLEEGTIIDGKMHKHGDKVSMKIGEAKGHQSRGLCLGKVESKSA